MLKYCGKTKIYAEELEGRSEIISNLKILIEEAKRFEKIMKTQLSSKERFYQKLKPEMEEVRSEEGSTCLTRSEIKKNYDGTLKNIFTRSEGRKAMDYPQSKHISPYKGNKKRNLYNITTILDEIWSKKRPAHDRTGLGYKKDK